MSKSTSRILLLADQPWQLELISLVCSSIKATEPNVTLEIALVDYYTFLHSPELIKRIEFIQGIKIRTLEDQYKGWQRREPRLTVEDEWRQLIEGRNLEFTRSHEELEKTNQYINGFERNRYQLPLGRTWEKQIYLDSLEWAHQLVQEVNPDLIISVERCTLPTNLLKEIAEFTSINFLTFIPSRIGDRWICRRDFGLGMNKQLLDEINSRYVDSSSTCAAVEIIKEIVTTRIGSYNSIEFQETNAILDRKSHPFRGIIQDARTELKQIYSRVFLERKNFPFKVKRLEQNLLKLSLTRLRRIRILAFYSLGIYKYANTCLPPTNFYFWALHARPEGSVLVLSGGVDEIDALFNAAAKLPTNTQLVVKENIENLGLRTAGFYSMLKANPKIWLLDATFSTFEAIQKSEGVVGISGTVLLEAKMLNKRVWALGNPEFLTILDRPGFNNENIFKRVVLGKEAELTIQKYVQYIIEESHPDDIPLYYRFIGDKASSEMAKRWASRIISEQYS